MDETQAVTTVNLDSLRRAQEEAGGPASPMSKFHTLKIYNPEPNKPADPEKDGKFILKLADNKGEVLIEGPIAFSPLDVKVFYAGSVYPIDPETGIRSVENKVFFYTNEFGKYAKKTDVIGLAAKGKALGFFNKGEFEQMIKSPRLNDVTNQFHDSKKDSKGVPYDGSALSRKFMVYGIFVAGEYAGEIFRMAVNPGAFGITFKDGANIEPEAGTFEYCFIEALSEMNALLTQNNLHSVNRVEVDQTDLSLQIVQNDKKNNLPYFAYEGLVAARNGDNLESRQLVRNVQEEQFKQTFVALDVPSKIQIEKGNVRVEIQAPAQNKQPQLAAHVEDAIDADEAEAVFEEEKPAPTKKEAMMKPPF